jgi:hypothetical protein
MWKEGCRALGGEAALSRPDSLPPGSYGATNTIPWVQRVKADIQVRSSTKWRRTCCTACLFVGES